MSRISRTTSSDPAFNQAFEDAAFTNEFDKVEAGRGSSEEPTTPPPIPRRPSWLTRLADEARDQRGNDRAGPEQPSSAGEARSPVQGEEAALNVESDSDREHDQSVAGSPPRLPSRPLWLRELERRAGREQQEDGGAFSARSSIAGASRSPGGVPSSLHPAHLTHQQLPQEFSSGGGYGASSSRAEGLALPPPGRIPTGSGLFASGMAAEAHTPLLGEPNEAEMARQTAIDNAQFALMRLRFEVERSSFPAATVLHNDLLTFLGAPYPPAEREEALRKLMRLLPQTPENLDSGRIILRMIHAPEPVDNFQVQPTRRRTGL